VIRQDGPYWFPAAIPDRVPPPEPPHVSHFQERLYFDLHGFLTRLKKLSAPDIGGGPSWHRAISGLIFLSSSLEAFRHSMMKGAPIFCTLNFRIADFLFLPEEQVFFLQVPAGPRQQLIRRL